MFTPTCEVTCPCRLTAARLTPAPPLFHDDAAELWAVQDVHVPARAGICDGPQLICIWHEQTCGLFSLLPELRSAGCRFIRFKAESSYLGQIFGLFLKDMSVANKRCWNPQSRSGRVQKSRKKKTSSEIFLQHARRISEDHTSPFLFIQK